MPILSIFGHMMSRHVSHMSHDCHSHMVMGFPIVSPWFLLDFSIVSPSYHFLILEQSGKAQKDLILDLLLLQNCSRTCLEVFQPRFLVQRCPDQNPRLQIQSFENVFKQHSFPHLPQFLPNSYYLNCILWLISYSKPLCQSQCA